MKVDDPQRQELINKAQQARSQAYAPYSGYAVGAALRTKQGDVFSGANIENAAYPLSMCAERVAIFSAVAAGERDFEMLVVATRNGGRPCGSCRQVMAEFGVDIEVLMVDEESKLLHTATVEELLPGAFTSGDLES